MSEPFVVRPAQSSDLAAVGALGAKLVHLHHTFDAARFFVPERVAEGYAWWLGEELARAEVVVLVAMRGDQLLGYAYGRLEERDWNLLLDPCGRLHDVWVEPEARGAGVGIALVEGIAAALRDKGAPRLVLTSAEGNGSAHALFAKLGFRRTMVEMTRELA